MTNVLCPAGNASLFRTHYVHGFVSSRLWQDHISTHGVTMAASWWPSHKEAPPHILSESQSLLEMFLQHRKQAQISRSVEPASMNFLTNKQDIKRRTLEKKEVKAVNCNKTLLSRQQQCRWFTFMWSWYLILVWKQLTSLTQRDYFFNCMWL